MGVSENRGTPKSSILIGFSIVNHPFWGNPIFGNTHVTGNLLATALRTEVYHESSETSAEPGGLDVGTLCR